MVAVMFFTWVMFDTLETGAPASVFLIMAQVGLGLVPFLILAGL